MCAAVVCMSITFKRIQRISITTVTVIFSHQLITAREHFHIHFVLLFAHEQAHHISYENNIKCCVLPHRLSLAACIWARKCMRVQCAVDRRNSHPGWGHNYFIIESCMRCNLHHAACRMWQLRSFERVPVLRNIRRLRASQHCHDQQ